MLSFIRKNIDLLLSWVKGLHSLNIATHPTAQLNGYYIIKIRTYSIYICYTDNQSTDRIEMRLARVRNMHMVLCSLCTISENISQRNNILDDKGSLIKYN